MTGTTTEPTPPPTRRRPSSPGPGPPPPPRRRRRSAGGSLAVFALLAVALVFLLVEGLGSSLDYFDTVEPGHGPPADVGHARPSGWRAPSSRTASTPPPPAPNFTICQGSDVVHVANTGSPPQLFQANVPVVVVGHFTSDTSDQFVSNSILVKHSSTYSAKYPTRVKATRADPVC